MLTPSASAFGASRIAETYAAIGSEYPPCHAVALSIDEKSQIRALDRTQPGLPLKPGKCATMTHDYKRNGTTTLFAALNVLDGTVLGRCMKRHRHQEFITFLKAVERKVPAGKIINVILDNYGTHKHPKVDNWLADHPRWVFHFTPASASWPNAVEGFFSAITRRRIGWWMFRVDKNIEENQRVSVRYGSALALAGYAKSTKLMTLKFQPERKPGKACSGGAWTAAERTACEP